jgi:hypothetical protein
VDVALLSGLQILDLGGVLTHSILQAAYPTVQDRMLTVTQQDVPQLIAAERLTRQLIPLVQDRIHIVFQLVVPQPIAVATSTKQLIQLVQALILIAIQKDVRHLIAVEL